MNSQRSVPSYLNLRALGGANSRHFVRSVVSPGMPSPGRRRPGPCPPWPAGPPRTPVRISGHTPRIGTGPPRRPRGRTGGPRSGWLLRCPGWKSYNPVDFHVAKALESPWGHHLLFPLRTPHLGTPCPPRGGNAGHPHHSHLVGAGLSHPLLPPPQPDSHRCLIRARQVCKA